METTAHDKQTTYTGIIPPNLAHCLSDTAPLGLIIYEYQPKRRALTPAANAWTLFNAIHTLMSGLTDDEHRPRKLLPEFMFTDTGKQYLILSFKRSIQGFYHTVQHHQSLHIPPRGAAGAHQRWNISMISAKTWSNPDRTHTAMEEIHDLNMKTLTSSLYRTYGETPTEPGDANILSMISYQQISDPDYLMLLENDPEKALLSLAERDRRLQEEADIGALQT